MENARLSNELGTEYTRKQAYLWLGDGGMLFVWSDINGSQTHADLWIMIHGQCEVTLYNFLGAVVSRVELHPECALDFAVAFVRGAQK